jgi:hypothetical protein
MARRGAVGLAVCVGLALSACTSGYGSPTTTVPPRATTTTTPPPTTAPPDLSPPPACPPGCSHPSDYDALTVLASSATLVAIVTLTSAGGSTVTVDRVLQGNPDGNVSPPAVQELPHVLAQARSLAGSPTATTYVLVTSYNRGGPCPSALFAYAPATQVATFLDQWSGLGPSNQIPLPGRVTTVPATVDLPTLQARLYPTGPVVHPTDTGESFCPGP